MAVSKHFNEDRKTKGAYAPCFPGEKAFVGLNELLLKFGAILIGLVTIPICADVFCRFILSNFMTISIDGVMELEIFALILFCFATMGHSVLQRSTLQVDILYNTFKSKTQIRLDIFGYAVGTSIAAVMAYEAFVAAGNETSLTAVLRLPNSAFVCWTGVGLAIVAVASLYMLLHAMKEAAERKDYAGIFLAIAAACILWALPFLYKMNRLRWSGLIIGTIGFVLLMVMLLLRVTIGLVMAFVGLLGMIALMRNPGIAFSSIGSIPFEHIAEFTFVALPMFMFRGEITFFSGISGDLFECANKWLGRLPGGLAIASVCGCAGFGAVCGDSLGCVITMSAVALPSMKDKKYASSLACGALASGGTLGILIPPSVGFIFYSILTEESIGKLFIAGVLPGILLTSIFCTIIFFWALRRPGDAPRADVCPFREKVSSLVLLLPVGGIFLLVVGGIMIGAFTPGEGGAIGAAGALLYAACRKRITLKQLYHAMENSAKMSGKIFLLFAGVYVLNAFLSTSRLPHLLASLITDSGVSKYWVLMGVVVLYLILGAVMNIVPMMMLTLPTIYPTITGVGFDGIWFGVVCVILQEMGMITPPIGMNVFTLSSLAPDIPMTEMFKGVLPFVFGMILCIVILTLFPEIALVLIR